MKSKLKLLIVLTVVWKCNGHLRILGDILSSAHDRIHSTVENVAGTVLGGLSHGLNFNVEGHVGVNGQRQPGLQPPSRPEETVVVVIEEENNNNNFRPPNNNFQRPHNPQYNNDYRPNNNPYNNQRPHNNFPNNENNFINGPPKRPNYGNRYPNNHYNGNPNNYNPNYNQGGHNHGPPPNRYPQNNNNGQGNYFNENNGNNNGYRPGNPGNNQVQPITPDVPEEPPNEFETKKPEYKPYHEVTTAKPGDDDAPLFIPLTDYNYGGDKINVTAPKRETNDKKSEEEDEDFGIDVRIKDT